MGGGVTHLQHVDPARYRDLSPLAFDVAPSRCRADGPGRVRPRGDALEPRARDRARRRRHGRDRRVCCARVHRRAALVGPRVERLLASGWSQTGLFWSSFLERGLPRGHACRSGRRRSTRTSWRSRPAPGHHPADAILVNLLSEAEVVGTLNPARASRTTPTSPPFRGYEVPGTFHLWNLAFGGPFRTQDHGPRHNDRSWYLLVHALLAGIERWSRGGAPLPHEPRIARDADAPDGVASRRARQRARRRAHALGRRAERALPPASASARRPSARCARSTTRPWRCVHGDGSRRAETWAAAVDALSTGDGSSPTTPTPLRAQPE